MSDFSDSIQDSDIDNDLELKKENMRLQKENENLINQLQLVLDLPKELEKFSEKNKTLTSQLYESNQKAENFQNRLKISQQKIQELDQKNQELQKQLQQFKKEYGYSTSKSNQVSEENTRLQKDLENYQSQISQRDSFFEHFSKVTGQKVNSFEQVLNVFSTIVHAQNKQKVLQKKEIESFQEESGKTIQKLIHKNKKLLDFNEELTKTIEKLQNENEKLKHTSNIIKVSLSDEKKTYESEKADTEAKILALSSKYDSQKMKADSLQLKLDQFIKDKEIEITRLRTTIDNKDKRIQELTNTLTNPEKEDNNQIQKMIQNLGNQKNLNEHLKEELSSTQNSLENFKKKASAAAVQIQKLQNEKLNAKKKLSAYAKKLAEKEELNKNLIKQNDELQRNLNDAVSEKEDLTLQLRAASASHTEGQVAWNSAMEEVQNYKKALNFIEKTVEQQRNEINKLNKERVEFIDIVHKQTQMILKYESTLQAETTKSQNLNNKLKHMEKEQLQKNSHDYEELNQNEYILSLLNQIIPELPRSKQEPAIQILKNSHVSIMKRLNAFIHNIIIPLSKSQNEDLSSSSQIKQNSNDNSNEVVKYVLKEFSSLLQQISNSGIKESQDLTTFISAKMAYLRSALHENESLNSQFISMDYLFNGQLEDRKQAINNLAQKGFSVSETYDLFCANALANIALDKLVQSQKLQLNDLNTQLSEIEEAFGCQSVDELHQILKAIESKSKEKSKKLHALKEQLKCNSSQNKQNKELSKRLQEQQELIESLQQDLRTVVNDATTLQKQLELKTQELNSLQTSHDNLRNESQILQQKHLDEMKQFEQAIDERNSECRTLKLQLSQVKAESEQTINILRNTNEDLKTTYSAKSEKWQKAFSLLKEKKDNLEDELKLKLKAKEKEHKEEIQKLMDSQEEMKKQISLNIEKLKESTKEKQIIAEKLADSLKESEEKNKKLVSEVGKLTQINKDLEIKIDLLNDQMKREIQVMSTQNAFKSMANETKHQEEMITQKNQFAKEKNSLVISVLNEFDCLDKFEDDAIDSEEFQRVIHEIGSEYRQMKNNTVFSLV